jgi:predicted O-methyltransferase YrrM
MSAERWDEVDRYTEGLLIGEDEVLSACLEDAAAAGLPTIAVTGNQGKLLHLILRIQGARRVLELGTLGGYSTIWMARALPADGRLVTLELRPEYAAVAAASIARAGLAELVELRVGPALESLHALREEGADPFDLIFIDADKESTPAYFEQALELCRAGGLIVVDNVVRDGALVEADSDNNPQVHGMRAFLELAAAEPRIAATTIQTVGSKGYDGFVLALLES